MTVEDTNPDMGSGNAELSTSLDDPSNWNFADPDDEAGEVNETPNEGSEIGQATDEPAENADENEAEQSAQDDDNDEPSEDSQEQTEDGEPKPEPATIQLANGESVTHDELVTGYMKGADYTRKTQEVAETRNQVFAQAERLSQQMESLTNYLVSALPHEPDASLAYSDPSTYMQQKAIYDQQLGQVQQLLSMADQPKQVAQEINQNALQERERKEFGLLAESFPAVRTEQGRKEFLEPVYNVAREFGFSEQEMEQSVDHRMFAMAHYANLGKKAEAAQKEAKRKVAAAPKAAPVKQRKANAKPNAMKTLAKTGSIHDAVNVDWD